MAWFATAAVAVTSTSVYGAVSSSNAANKAAANAQNDANRRYGLKSSIAEGQMEEQQSIAMEKMTDVSRQFLVAKGTAIAQQAESGVTGVSAQRIAQNKRMKASEVKSSIAKNIDTNVINIAQGNMADKIETDSAIAAAEAKKQNVFTNAVIAGIGGAASGYSLGSSISANGGFGSNKVGVKDVS